MPSSQEDPILPAPVAGDFKQRSKKSEIEGSKPAPTGYYTTFTNIQLRLLISILGYSDINFTVDSDDFKQLFPFYRLHTNSTWRAVSEAFKKPHRHCAKISQISRHSNSLDTLLSGISKFQNSNYFQPCLTKQMPYSTPRPTFSPSYSSLSAPQ